MAEEFIDEDGCHEWFQDGKLHREDGPAVITPENRQFWYKYGFLHREDGPAMIFKNNTYAWYLNGKRINCSTNEEFLKIIQLKEFW